MLTKGIVRRLGRISTRGCVRRMHFEGSEAYALNERGQVVGQTSTRSDAGRAFLWEHGRMRDLGSPSPKTFSRATGINESGLVTGETGDPDFPDDALGGFVWRAGRIEALPPDSPPVAVNDRGQVLVDALMGPLLWTSGDVRLLNGFDVDTASVDLNNQGQVAGTLSALGMGVPRAAAWDLTSAAS